MLYTIPRKLFAHILCKHAKALGKHSVVADIGCGLGDITAFAAAGLKKTTVGFDIDFQTCALARKNTSSAGTSAIVLYNGATLPLRNGCADLIYSHEVIEHVPDDMLLFSEVARVLKNDGVFIVATPNAAKEPLDNEFHRDHVRHYTKPSLIARLQSAGFVIETTYWRYHALGAAIDGLLCKIGGRGIRGKQVQHSMTAWSVAEQRFLLRTLLRFYAAVIDPVITALVLAEFNIKKQWVESANMVMVCRKQAAGSSGVVF